MAQLDKPANDSDVIFLHVFAPVLTQYVTWVLKTAYKDGNKRLYFLARDGWMMYELAKKISSKLNLNMDLRYIYVSRYVLKNAEYYFIGRRCIDSICVGGIDITFYKIMKRAALTDKEILIVAEETGYKDRLNECLSYVQIQELKKRLDGFSLSFFDFVYAHSRGFYEDITNYFEYVGLIDDVKFAVVDSGWLGTTAVSMGNILSYMTKRQINISGYYFGLYELPKSGKNKNFKAYYLHPNLNIGRKTRFSICLFETLFSAPVGMTMGYRTEEEKVVPILSTSGNPNKNVIERNKDLLMIYESYLEAGDLSVGKLEKLLSLIMGKPTKEEAKIFGNLQFCDDVLELQMQHVAADWDEIELRKQSFLRKILIKFFKSKEKLHESGWPEASIVNLVGTGIRGKWALFNERLYKRGMYVRKAIKK